MDIEEEKEKQKALEEEKRRKLEHQRKGNEYSYVKAENMFFFF